MSGPKRAWCRGSEAPRPLAAFTLVELLVVMSVIGILMALIMPAIQSVREAARRTQCANQLKQLNLGMLQYETIHKEFTPGFSNPGMTMWSGFILPYIEQGNLYKSIDVEGLWVTSTTTHPQNIEALGSVLEIFLCPSASIVPAQYDPHMEADRVYSCYLACASGTNNRESGALPWCGMNAYDGYPASDGIFYFNSRTRQVEITDGTSNTLLLGETLPDQHLFQDDYSGNSQKVDHWTMGSGELGDYTIMIPVGSAEVSECLGSTACPLNSIKRVESPMNDKELGFGSAHPTGGNLSYADGHVRFVSESIDPQVLIAIGTRSAGEVNVTAD